MINNIPDIALFQIGGQQFGLLSLMLILLVVFIAFLLNKLMLRLLGQYSRSKQLSQRFKRFVRIGFRGFNFIISLIVIFEIIGINYLSVLQHRLYQTDKFSLEVYNVLVLIVVIYVIRLFVYLLQYLIEHRISDKRLDKGRAHSFFLIVKYLIWVIGIIVIISSLGFKMTIVIASLSALLVGVGFGLQHVFNDLISGIIILFDGSIEVDDVVEVEGTVGRVIEIGLRVSKLLTRDNVVIIIPNSRFTGEKVINWSHNKDVTRFHVNVGVAYGSDVRLVEKVLLECAFSHKDIVKNPKPFVRFNDFGESSLDFQLYFWTANNFLVENIKSDIRFDIDDHFRKNNVVIPFPQRDLHLKTKNFNG